MFGVYFSILLFIAGLEWDIRRDVFVCWCESLYLPEASLKVTEVSLVRLDEWLVFHGVFIEFTG